MKLQVDLVRRFCFNGILDHSFWSLFAHLHPNFNADVSLWGGAAFRSWDLIERELDLTDKDE